MNMKTSLIAALGLVGHAAAWYGQMAADPPSANEGGNFQIIHLTDYNTGSTYDGSFPGFNYCAPNECNINFHETSPGGYNFNAKIWRTNDGCHNIDFRGALSSGHGYCCGSLPCTFTA